ncbi:MAG: ATP-grasp domain-containing protein [Flaviramulus sp.]|nr:ATP-grasp domain-containing protein [Flaviramulus sp.]NNC49534.1 ATP-grasp domain-containing protein [Flaviramulus sp.]
MSNILITSAGRRVSLVRAFKKELKQLIPNGKVYVTDFKPELSAASQIADKEFRVYKIDDKNYINILLELCVKNNIKLIIPTLDSELLILAQNINKFKDSGITIVISDEHFVNTCYNKIATQDFFENSNIRVALVYNKTNFKLPLFIKPINGSNSIDTTIVKYENQISKFHIENDELFFFEYIDSDIYDEFTCDLYYDKRGQLKCVIPRKRIEVRGGEISKGVTCNNRIKKIIEENFKTIKGARGCITMQFFMNNDEDVIGIEINARFGGGFPLSYLAGGNYPKWIIQEYLLNENIAYFDDWKTDLLMLRYDEEILVENYEN